MAEITQANSRRETLSNADRFPRMPANHIRVRNQIPPATALVALAALLEVVAARMVRTIMTPSDLCAKNCGRG